MMGNNFMKSLDLKCPIIQAPMAGGITTPVLVSEVSNQGALGMIGAGYLKPDQLRVQINQVKALTNANFGVNLFVPEHFELNEDQVAKSKELINNYEFLLNHKMKEPDLPTKEIEKQTYEELLKIVIEERVAACSFTFGIPSKKTIESLKQNGIMTIGTATTV